MARVLAALALMATAMVLTAAVGRQVVLASDRIMRWDADLVERTTATALARPWLVDALLVWSHLTEPWLLFTVLAIASGLLFWRGLVRRRALWVTPMGLAGWGLAIGCKYIVARPRPTPPEAITTAGGFSYPSGHATGSTIAMILTCVLIWPLARSVASRVLLVATAVTVVLLTCADRVFLGVHYLSDVVAGVVVGSAMTTAALLLVLRPRGSASPAGAVLTPGGRGAPGSGSTARRR
ncbi:hypothetical protein GCM10022199_03970 [Marihabitans asiaticum]|uniref:Undecaprenyl-diphosphatase n=1 Tax=Marihabitans asiaticum TaxID=415218 RepID=A0A560WE27_9MICO|nr:undecaprenyl-diphosphatase [Marihabitans asiaticum]